MQKLHNRSHNECNYQIGDNILVQSHYLSKGVDKFTAKLAINHKEPYVIIEFLIPANLLVRDCQRSSVMNVHVAKTKPLVEVCIGGSPRCLASILPHPSCDCISDASLSLLHVRAYKMLLLRCVG
ncbi:hypothetical protein PR048_000503 [Dryococelus australis]|uniref:Uncharacterized protein n=1 Tax=Dryococelus australis TaxID=614101 RepID=A0ABQ9IH50_9NEOP|nr:hypothetical protein PR048_000503 [Dryococelus australis]